MVMMLDLRLKGHAFDSRSGCYQVVTAWMGGCLPAGKPSWCITSSAFHPSGLLGCD